MTKIYCRASSIILRASATERPEPTRFERHCHRQYELLYVVHGKGKCVVEGSEYPLEAGSLFIFRPFEYHYVCPDPESPYERYVCNFDENILMNAVKKLPMLDAKSAGIRFFDGRQNDNFCNTVKALDEFFEQGEPEGEESRAMAVTAVNRLLLLLSRERSDPPEPNELVAHIIEYFSENLDKKISLDETAKRFFISKYYLCRIFRRHTGVTVLSYLSSKRMAMAQQMIEQGEPPTSVAYAVGYGDYSSFYRAYVKETGRSPSK